MKYIALLRGVNVGGRIIKSVDLTACFGQLGFDGVRTILQSGNVIFESDELDEAELRQQIEAGLSATFGYSAKAQVIGADNLKKIIEIYPFGAADDSQHDYVIFMENGLEKQLAAEPCELAPEEKIRAGAGVVYWRVEKGQTLKTNFAKLLTKSKYKTSTTRNLRTLQKLI